MNKISPSGPKNKDRGYPPDSLLVFSARAVMDMNVL